MMDNLIAANKLRKMIAPIVDNGGGDAQSSERGVEYHTVSGKFAEFVETEKPCPARSCGCGADTH